MKETCMIKKKPKQPHSTSSHFQSSVITHLFALLIQNVILQMYQIFTSYTCFPWLYKIYSPKVCFADGL